MGGAPRVVFFGMDSEFSTRALLALLEGGIDVRAVVKPLGGVALRKTNMATRVPKLMTRLKEQWLRVVDPEHHRPPELNGERPPEDPFTIAEAKGIPCYIVGDASGTHAVRLLRRHHVDVYCVAFFNQLLRKELLAVPDVGSVNLHPSLLPAYRGPSPLFWIFKNAARESGVTLHMIHPGEDDGDILGQYTVPLTDGMRGPELLSIMAVRGAELMVRGVRALCDGSARMVPQDPARAFRSPRPEPEDCRVGFSRSARDVFNFVRGVCMWVPLFAEVGNERVEVMDAQSFQTGGSLGRDHVLSGNVLMAQCQDGMVALKIRPRPWPFATIPAAVTQGQG